MRRDERGQSLVEIAVIVPLLLFIFIGVVEVGWAIVVHIQLLQWSRETARFAVRENIMDYSLAEPGYDKVKAHFDEISANRTARHFTVDGDEPTASLYMMRFEVAANLPCPDVTGCHTEDCNALTLDDLYTDDDTITTYIDDPLFVMAYGLPEPSRVEVDTVTDQMRLDGGRLNCLRQLRGDSDYGKADQLFLVEINYSQPQLLGFPVYSWLGNIPHHVTTLMRFTRGGPRP